MGFIGDKLERFKGRFKTQREQIGSSRSLEDALKNVDLHYVLNAKFISSGYPQLAFLILVIAQARTNNHRVELVQGKNISEEDCKIYEVLRLVGKEDWAVLVRTKEGVVQSLYSDLTKALKQVGCNQEAAEFIASVQKP
jgi:hypothetical protein